VLSSYYWWNEKGALHSKFCICYVPCKAMEHLLYMTHYVDDILFWKTIKAIICIGLSMESIVLKFLCIWKIAKRLPRPPAS